MLVCICNFVWVPMCVSKSVLVCMCKVCLCSHVAGNTCDKLHFDKKMERERERKNISRDDERDKGGGKRRRTVEKRGRKEREKR
jgi:hypothetical protein